MASETARLLAAAKAAEKAGRAMEAHGLYTRLLQHMPNHKQARAALARLPQPAGPDPKALARLQKHMSAGAFTEAIAVAAPLAAAFPGHADLQTALGIAHAQTGQLAAAKTAFAAACAADPKSGARLNNLASVERLLDQPMDALRTIERARKLAPRDHAILLNHAHILVDNGEYSEARDLFETALETAPADATAFDGLFRIYDRGHAPEAFAEALDRAQSALGPSPTTTFWQAVHASQIKDHARVVVLLEAIEVDALPSEKRARAAELLAKAQQAEGDHRAAFASFENMNRLAAARAQFGPEASPFLAGLRVKRDSLDGFKKPEAAPPADGNGPLFLVGFPRSGTTLLDTFLRGHSQIEVIEEKPTVQRMVEALDPTLAQDVAVQIELPQREAERLRSIYRDELGRHINTGAPVVADKMPLNLADAFLLHRVFPNAKFALSLRHPMDAVLSCFMQNFRSNAAMDCFLDLRRTADVYDHAMTLWCAAADALPLRVADIRYERLVEEPEAQIRPLLFLLGLKWEEAMADTQATARSRARINTPSYNQVTQKLYQGARDRWRNYRTEMAEVAPILAPWAERFGYEM